MNYEKKMYYSKHPAIIFKVDRTLQLVSHWKWSMWDWNTEDEFLQVLASFPLIEPVCFSNTEWHSVVILNKIPFLSKRRQYKSEFMTFHKLVLNLKNFVLIKIDIKLDNRISPEEKNRTSSRWSIICNNIQYKPVCVHLLSLRIPTRMICADYTFPYHGLNIIKVPCCLTCVEDTCVFFKGCSHLYRPLLLDHCSLESVWSSADYAWLAYISHALNVPWWIVVYIILNIRHVSGFQKSKSTISLLARALDPNLYGLS